MSFLRQVALRGRGQTYLAVIRPSWVLSTGWRQIPIRNDSSSSSPPVDSNDFEKYALNVRDALMKDSEGRAFSDVVNDDVSVIEGIGINSRSAMEALGIRTVEELARYKYFLIARSILTLAETEKSKPGGRPAGSTMNIDRAVDKPYRTMTFTEIADAPVAALYGLSEEKGELMGKTLGVRTVADLAKLKYCHWAESMLLLSKYEK